MERPIGPTGRAVSLFVLSLSAGIQTGLYLADRFDDGVADWRSALIAALLVLLALAALVSLLRRRQ